MNFVTVKLYEATRNNAKLASSLLKVPMVKFIHDAIMEKVERDIDQDVKAVIDWELLDE